MEIVQRCVSFATFVRAAHGMRGEHYLMGDQATDSTLEFRPKFDEGGLIAAICVDVQDGTILMVAHMNDEALDLTRRTGVAHFWSRSRQRLWKKGETSGNMLQVAEILVDCDQDCLLVRVEPSGPACHTGRRSCFYRRLTAQGLEMIDK